MITRILIDSRHVSKKSHPFHYDFKLSDLDVPVIKNVCKIEVKNVCFPKIQDELYFLLKIGNLNSNLYVTSSSSAVNDCFGVIFFDNGSMPTGAYKPMKNSDFSIKAVDFDGQKPTLQKIEVEMLKHDGTRVEPADTAGQVGHVIMLEVTSV